MVGGVRSQFPPAATAGGGGMVELETGMRSWGAIIIYIACDPTPSLLALIIHVCKTPYKQADELQHITEEAFVKQVTSVP